MYCKHPNLRETARSEYCPDCGFYFYYGDAHANDEESQKSKLLESGEDEYFCKQKDGEY